MIIDLSTVVPLPDSVASTKPARKPKAADWWYSTDGKRGFCWSTVAGHDYRAGGSAGFTQSVLYLYLSGALLHLVGTEADTVWQQIKERKVGKA